MQYFKYEFFKIVNRKISFVALVLTVIIFPVIIAVISKLEFRENRIDYGIAIESITSAILIYSQVYFCIPVWIIIFTGQELSSGHVNRIIFSKGKTFYFRSKLVYCLIVAFLFSLIGLISLHVTLRVLSISNILPMTQVAEIWLQMFLSAFCYSVVLLVLVFLIKSPIVTFVVYSIWTFTEGVLFNVLNRICNVNATWLPLHFVRLLFATNGEAKTANYIRLFETGYIVALVPIVSILFAILLSAYFKRTDINPLTD
jgi:hypothetical protein